MYCFKFIIKCLTKQRSICCLVAGDLIGATQQLCDERAGWGGAQLPPPQQGAPERPTGQGGPPLHAPALAAQVQAEGGQKRRCGALEGHGAGAGVRQGLRLSPFHLLAPHDGAGAAPAEPAEGLPNRLLQLQLNGALYRFG